jgi:AraC-like DNA-binding protein
VLLIPPNKLHQLDIKDSAMTYERFVVWLNQRYLKRISTSKTDLNTCFLQAHDHNAFLIRNSAVSDKTRHILDGFSVSQTGDFGADIENEERIKTLLVLLGQYFLQNRDDFTILGKANPCVTKAIDYISEHISQDLSLDAIASALFVDKYYFAHIFKEYTNTSPHRYILKKRLVLSKQFIEEGFPITEVFAKCGFSDYTHFFRAFKNEFGITPKQFYASISLQP